MSIKKITRYFKLHFINKNDVTQYCNKYTYLKYDGHQYVLIYTIR